MRDRAKTPTKTLFYTEKSNTCPLLAHTWGKISTKIVTLIILTLFNIGQDVRYITLPSSLPPSLPPSPFQIQLLSSAIILV